MKKDYSRDVELICPICGGNSFEFDSECVDCDYTCIGCKKVFTHDEIIESNHGSIDSSIEDVKKEITDDVIKRLKSAFND